MILHLEGLGLEDTWYGTCQSSRECLFFKRRRLSKQKSLQHPHRTRRAQLADDVVYYPLRRRYRFTDYTIEGREEAKILEGAEFPDIDEVNSIKSASEGMFPDKGPNLDIDDQLVPADATTPPSEAKAPLLGRNPVLL